ncbi:hypothetical protein PQC07_gp128 [Aeromonas phage D3]|uniref:Uncharacterized protein n=2 Tax=Ludhianavirus TaxID=3044751 RepID=A0A7D6ISF7_9CAUD|nr:hypothetical protein PQC07_gp128 [Aeromonas phage D3]YP_010668896.1 hypothetical protein PQC08_gp127 [Aeromonas phage D6]QLM02903.1 hypothetical protein D3_0147 [Aeromonas phage D3]QNH80845.1 hypothetical protein D6_0148 [Aeromonas phage D6]
MNPLLITEEDISVSESKDESVPTGPVPGVLSPITWLMYYAKSDVASFEGEFDGVMYKLSLSRSTITREVTGYIGRGRINATDITIRGTQYTWLTSDLDTDTNKYPDELGEGKINKLGLEVHEFVKSLNE